MRNAIIRTLVGGVLAGAATLALTGAAHAQGGGIGEYHGDYPSKWQCEAAGNRLTSGGFGTPVYANCVPNGGGPSDVKSWSLYVR